MRAVEFFLGVNMCSQHDGLKKLAKKHKVDLDTLPARTACVFISRDRRRIKVYSANGVLSYLRAADYRPFDLSALDKFPEAFDAEGNLNYEKALRLRLEKEFAQKGPLEEQHL